MTTAESYRDYLGLDEVLAAPSPLSSEEEPSLWAAERFFIVAHLSSELWASQAFVDLERARALAQDSRWGETREALIRVGGIVALLEATLAGFQHLEAKDFALFRPLLDGISAAESDQFQELLQGRRHPAIDHINRLAEACRDDRPADAQFRAVEQVGTEIDEIVASIGRWRWSHVELARRLIAEARGTGGTSGVTHLEERGSGELTRFIAQQRS